MKTLIEFLILILFIFVIVYSIVYIPNTLEKMDQINKIENNSNKQ